jgi:DNA-binding transcriptional LysR family regulator
LKRLKDGELDVVFVSRKPGLPGFREQVAWHDELVLVVPAAVASTTDALSSDGAPRKILVQRLGCSYTERLLALLAARARPYRLLELGTLEGILGFVEVGVGIAVMPRAFVETLATTRKVRLLPLPRDVRRLATYLVAPASKDASQVVNAFVTGCEHALIRSPRPPRRRAARAR